MHGFLLTIYDIECNGMPDADEEMGGGLANPYIKFAVQLSSGVCGGKTSTVQDGKQNVQWTDDVLIVLPGPLVLEDLDSAKLRVTVWHQDEIDEDDLMGTVVEPISSLGCKHIRRTTVGEGKLHSFAVNFSYKVTPCNDVKLQEPQKQLEAAASKKPKSSVSGRPVTSDSENGWCLLRLPTTPFSCDALVSFANIAAKDVPDADNNSGGEHTRCVVQTGRLLDGSFALTRAAFELSCGTADKSDPYMIFSVRRRTGQAFSGRNSTKMNAVNATWNETVDIPVSLDVFDDGEIEVEVFDDDMTNVDVRT